MYCVGCGEPLGESETVCAVCKTAAVGASFDEAVIVTDGQALRVPWVCCCCLEPSDTTDDVKLSSPVVGGRLTLTIPIPWCAECRSNRKLQSRTAFLALAPMVYVGWLLAGVALEEELRFLASVGLGFALTFALLMTMDRVVPSLRQPGHVPGCAGIGGGVARQRATVRFRNRAFATIWRDLQAGHESNVTALLRAVKVVAPLPEASRPLPSGAAGETARKLGADAMREQIRKANAGEPRGARHGAAFLAGGATTGADAAASALRFVAKDCELDAAGVRVRGKDGRQETLVWADLAEVRVRQLPAGPPYDGALLLDLVRVPAPDGAVRPLRLLPTTRVNYNVLPGAGVTSQQNFRRLASHVLAQSPAARCEPASVPFVNEGKAAPRLSSASEIVAYEEAFA
jgi:hypothetical protein